MTTTPLVLDPQSLVHAVMCTDRIMTELRRYLTNGGDAQKMVNAVSHYTTILRGAVRDRHDNVPPVGAVPDAQVSMMDLLLIVTDMRVNAPNEADVRRFRAVANSVTAKFDAMCQYPLRTHDVENLRQQIADSVAPHVTLPRELALLLAEAVRRD